MIRGVLYKDTYVGCRLQLVNIFASLFPWDGGVFFVSTHIKYMLAASPCNNMESRWVSGMKEMLRWWCKAPPKSKSREKDVVCGADVPSQHHTTQWVAQKRTKTAHTKYNISTPPIGRNASLQCTAPAPTTQGSSLCTKAGQISTGHWSDPLNGPEIYVLKPWCSQAGARKSKFLGMKEEGAVYCLHRCICCSQNHRALKPRRNMNGEFSIFDRQKSP